MKHKKRILTALCLIIGFIVAIAQTGCKEEKLPVGTDPIGGMEMSYFYVISGARDFYVDLSATKAAVDTSSIKAYRENGEGTAESVSMDDSAVTWGVKGVYSVKYIAGDSSVECKIYIYDATLPTIIGAIDKTVRLRDEVLLGVSATDQFGFSLAVTYFVGDVEKGALSVGNNIVTYQTADLAGNIQTVSVTITLE